MSVRESKVTDAIRTRRRKARRAYWKRRREKLRLIAEEQRIEKRNEMVENNQGLIGKVIGEKFRWALGKFEFADLMQGGNIGLMRAADLFDPSLGWEFSTYAYYWISQSIQRMVENEGDLVRIPVHMHELRGTVRRTEESLLEKLGRTPTAVEVAESAGLRIKQVRTAYARLFFKILWLDNELPFSRNGDATTLAELTPDVTKISPDVLVMAQEEFMRTKKRIQTLLLDAEKMGASERDLKIFKLRHGLDGSYERKTLSAIGKEFGLTKERVRQITMEIWHATQVRGSKMDADDLMTEVVRADAIAQLASV